MPERRALFVRAEPTTSRICIVGKWYDIQRFYHRDNAHGRDVARGQWSWEGLLSHPTLAEDRDRVHAEAFETLGGRHVVARTFSYRAKPPTAAEVRGILGRMADAVASRARFESPLGFFFARESRPFDAPEGWTPKTITGYVSDLVDGHSYAELRSWGHGSVITDYMTQRGKDPIIPVLRNARRLAEAGLSHGHLHFGNIVTDDKGNVRFVDPTRLVRSRSKNPITVGRQDVTLFLANAVSHGVITEDQLVPSLVKGFGASERQARALAEQAMQRLQPA